MKAIALDRFGGPETLTARQIPLQPVGPSEVRIRVSFAGVGSWDSFEREGGYAKMLRLTPRFPYILGSEGAGTIVEVGAEVKHVRVGDAVMAIGFLNPSGGFYAEYVVVDADLVIPLPPEVSLAEGAVVGGIGITALRGLEDVLLLRADETVWIHGASGGIGHVAVQLAKRSGARVFAVASGGDGVRLARELGADDGIDGRSDDVGAALRRFAPTGFDAALLTAGIHASWLDALRPSGRVAFPTGVIPEPPTPPHLRVSRYNGEPDGKNLRRLQAHLLAKPLRVYIDRRFPLEQAAEAHEGLGRHHLGKWVLEVS